MLFIALVSGLLGLAVLALCRKGEVCEIPQGSTNNAACHGVGLRRRSPSWYRNGMIGFAAIAMGVVAASPSGAGDLHAQFIGNMAFHITDGRTSLLTDFPYEPGYAGYMRWTPEQVPKTSEHTLCLITHGHRDHFDRERFAAMTATVVGPKEVVHGFESRSFPMAPRIEYHGIAIEPVATKHGDREHYSYRVTWNDLRLYFTGDTDDVEPLLRERDLDVAFVSPWLLEAARTRVAKIGAKRVVVYHHAEQYMGPDYQDRVLPKQGEKLLLTAAGPSAALTRRVLRSRDARARD